MITNRAVLSSTKLLEDPYTDWSQSMAYRTFQHRWGNEVAFCLFGFLTSSSTTRLYRGRAPRQGVWQFYVLPHMRESWETMTSVSAGHIILTPTQPVGSGLSLRGSNLGPALRWLCRLFDKQYQKKNYM